MKKKPAAKKPRDRTLRREAERDHEKNVRERERAFAALPGGTDGNPIEVMATSQISIVARGLVCARCLSTLDIAHEASRVLHGRVTRRVELACRQCGAKRTAHFAVATPTLN